MTRRILAGLFFAAAFTLLARADGPAPKSEAKDTETLSSNSPVIVNLRDQQSNLKSQYKEIKAHVSEIAAQLLNSPDAEKQEKGKAINKALENAGDEIERKFETLETLLQNPNQQKIDSAKDKITNLRKDLQDLIKQLKEADKGPDRKKEIEALTRKLEEIKRLAREQQNEQTRVELGRADKNQLGKEQNKITKDTGKVIGKGDAKSSQGSEGKDKAGEGKPEGKGSDPKGEGKNETAKPKGEDKKPNDPKDPKNGPQGEAKGSKGDPKNGPQGEAKGSKGDPKDSKSDGKGDPKKGDPMKSDPKESKSESKEKKDGKGEGKGKPNDSKSPPSDSKGDGQPMESKGSGKGSKQKPQDTPAGDQKKQEKFPGKERVEEANEYQKESEKEIDKGDNDAAAKKQKQAGDKLKEAQKELEARLRQLRKDEIDRILGDMLGRCNRMLTAQKDVREDTVRLDKSIKSHSTRDRADVNKGDELSKKEAEIVKMADDALQLIREEGSSVAFPIYLDFARNLMISVRVRLSKTDAGATTIATEDEIIRNLQEMIAALEQAKKENQQQPPPPGGGGGNPNPGNKPLLQELQELKLIRNMQISVHKMTEAYGLDYKGKEQAPAPEKSQTADDRELADRLKKDLKDLAVRQEQIYQATNDLYKGKNK